VIQQATDLSSLSDELQQQAVTWAETYHLSMDRANVLRSLELSDADRILEVGAGCGAITRYAGERCGLVDGIEPDASRAEVGAARVRDLPNTEIHVAELDEVPDVPFYDVALVVGVLEYVGLGAAEREPYIDFLRKIKSRLAPGGVVICAIENLLGVKYLCGSPEDHTGRPFDGLTGYRNGGKARTFSRPELSALFEAAGLEPAFLHLFPDYKMTRAVLADRIFDQPYAPLALEIPEFPSPDRVPGSVRVADERDAWETLITAGQGAQCANSFLVIGRTEGSPSRWPAHRLATFYSQRRAAMFRTETRVELDSKLEFIRNRLTSLPCRVGTLTQAAVSSDYIEGVLLSDQLETVGRDEMQKHLAAWRDLVRASPGSIDLIPKNVRVQPSGELVAFDQEWRDDSWPPEAVLARGILSLWDRLAARWHTDAGGAEGLTARAGAARLGELVGLTSDGSWIDDAIDREAALTATVGTGATGGETWELIRSRVREDYLVKFPAAVAREKAPLPIRALRRADRALRVLVRGY